MPVIDTPTVFGRCIFTLRRELGLTQAEFASRMGLSRQGITRVEAGLATLSFFALVRLSDRLGREVPDDDAAALFSLFDFSIGALQEAGIRVFNRHRRPEDDLAPMARVDRIIGRIYDEEFRRYREQQRLIPVRIVRFDDDEDDED